MTRPAAVEAPAPVPAEKSATAWAGLPRAVAPGAPPPPPAAGASLRNVPTHRPDQPSPEDPLRIAARGLASPGRGLLAAPRRFFEDRFGTPLGHVRVHDDHPALEAARALDADAFTVGHHVVGAPTMELLAHELAHVVQHRGSIALPPLRLGTHDDLAERAADRAAAEVLAGRSASGLAPLPSGGIVRRRRRKAAKKETPPPSDLVPLMFDPDSADNLASYGVQLIHDVLERTDLSGRRFVIIVVMNGVHLYSSDGKLLESYRQTGSPPTDGVLLDFDGHTVKLGTRGGSLSKDDVAWDEKDKPHVWSWSSVTEEQYKRLAGSPIVSVFIVPRFQAANDSPKAKDDVAAVVDPSAVPGTENKPGSTSKKKKRKAKATSTVMKAPESGDEYEGEVGEEEANYPAFPARIAQSATLVPTTGSSELNMYLDWMYGETQLIGAVWNASTTVKYHWERYDITALVNAGVAPKADDDDVRQAPKSSQATVTDQYIEHDAKQRVRDLEEDVSNSVSTIASGGTKGNTTRERVGEVTTEVFNVAMSPVSLTVSSFGHAIDSIWHKATKPDDEITLEWNTPGYFLVRCIAYPQEHRGRRYAPSVAVTLVEVRDTKYMAEDTLAKGDAAIDELKLRRALATDPAVIARIDEQIAQLETTTHGSAVEALEVAIKQKQMEVDAAVGRPKERRQDELDSLKKQLKFARSNESGVGGHALRPEASLASEVTGATYPLLLQLIPLSTGETQKWAIYDVTTKGDNLGHAYVGKGADTETAIKNAFAAFCGKNEYGRGIVIMKIPSSVPDVGGQQISHRNVKVGDALAKERINDLVVVLVALSIFIPGVGEAAMLLTGAMAAKHIYDRWKDGNLEFDAALVSDLIAILGAVGSAASEVANLRIIRAKNGYAVAVETADAAAIAKSLEAVESAVGASKWINVGNQIVGYGGLLWGDIQVIHELDKINEDEADGRLTHAQARSARAKALLGAVQNHLLMYAGPLKDAVGAKSEPLVAEDPTIARPSVDEPTKPTVDSTKPAVETSKPTVEPVRPSVEPTMPAIESPGQATEPPSTAGGGGAVRGKDNYPLRDPAHHNPLKVGSREVQEQLVDAVSERTNTGEANLEPTTKPGHYKLDVAGVGGNAASSVAVKIEMVSGFDAASTPHGGEAGPARLELVRNGSSWEATIKIHEMVGKKDVSRIAAHEFDEIIDIVQHADPAATDAAVNDFAAEQMRAEVYRPGAPSGKKATAHDRAAARELARAINDLVTLRANKGDTKALEERVANMKASMGLAPEAGAPASLSDATGIRGRVAALDAMGIITAETMRAIGTDAEVARAAQSAASAPAKRTMSSADVLHLQEPELQNTYSKGSFEKTGISGGHVDSELQAAVNDHNKVPGNSQLTLKLVKTKVGPDGHTYRAYEQEAVTTGGVAKAMDGADPLYKTTVDDPHALLDSGLSAFDEWAGKTGASKGPPPGFGPASAGAPPKLNGEWTGVAANGVVYGGFATWEPTTGTWTIKTAYPKASWIL